MAAAAQAPVAGPGRQIWYAAGSLLVFYALLDVVSLLAPERMTDIETRSPDSSLVAAPRIEPPGVSPGNPQPWSTPFVDFDLPLPEQEVVAAEDTIDAPVEAFLEPDVEPARDSELERPADVAALEPVRSRLPVRETEPELTRLALRSTPPMSAREPVVQAASSREAVDPGEAQRRAEERITRIARPDASREHSRLDAWLHGCIGVRNGLLGADGRLTAIEGLHSSPVVRGFSSLARSVDGWVPPAERRRLDNLRAQYGAGTPVRLFPQWFDAILMARMRGLSEPGPQSWIRYRFDGDLHLELDGRRHRVAPPLGGWCAGRPGPGATSEA